MRPERRAGGRRGGGPGGGEFGLAAVAPERADGRDPVAAGADDVVLAVAPHDARLGGDSLLDENVGDEVALVVEAAVELAP